MRFNQQSHNYWTIVKLNINHPQIQRSLLRQSHNYWTIDKLNINHPQI
ncbi:hypothetical protein [Okeania sp. KiyG1]|nr:hypothetical protein [Okeania sp. KiyG1]